MLYPNSIASEDFLKLLLQEEELHAEPDSNVRGPDKEKINAFFIHLMNLLSKEFAKHMRINRVTFDYVVWKIG